MGHNFAGGLRCMDCKSIIPEHETPCERLTDVGENSVIVEMICAVCDIKVAV